MPAFFNFPIIFLSRKGAKAQRRRQSSIEKFEMQAKYDPDVDILRISWSDIQIEESDEISPGVILDFDQENNVVGVEIINASKKIENLAVLSSKLISIS